MGAFPGLESPVEFPTLGWGVIDWLESNLAMMDGKGGPLRLTNEQALIILHLYRVDLESMRRVYRRALISTAKGWGSSPVLAMLVAAECMADVLPDGLDANGNLVGRPWRDKRTVYGQLAAVSERQTGNAWNVLLEMLGEGPAMDNYPGLEVFDAHVRLPGNGRILPITSSAGSAEGEKPVIVGLDQTEAWKSNNGGHQLAAVLRRNAGKVGGLTVETPNAHVPGDDSVAERTFIDYQKITEGKSRTKGILHVYREAPPDTDLSDPVSLRKGLEIAYGDAVAWNDLDRLMEEIWDTSTDPDDARRYYLSQLTQATDAWISQIEWMSCFDKGGLPLADGDIITLGFDGSRKRMKGVTDATALHACRLSDGKVFEIETWEQPEGPDGDDWEVPLPLVDLTVRDTFSRYRVVGFFADPARWESYIDTWEADFGKDLRVKASPNHPIAYWLTGSGIAKFVPALRRFQDAVLDGELKHDGSRVTTRHVLNARRRSTRYGISIAKATPDSPHKIDGAISATLAYECRNQSIASGVLADEQAPKRSRRLHRF